MANLNIPASAFPQPTPDQEAQNADYWTGYAQGMSVVDGVVPSAAGVADYATYSADVAAVLRDPVTASINIGSFTYKVVNSVTVGWNAAISDGADWEWINDPNSGHNKVIG